MNLSATPWERVLLIGTYDLGHQPFGLASLAAWLSEAGFQVPDGPVCRRSGLRQQYAGHLRGLPWNCCISSADIELEREWFARSAARTSIPAIPSNS